jgi:hypothetical protein
MNKIHIEEYRGFDIYFDKDNEVFSCISGEYDVQKNKNSFTLARKEIDSYIKENQNFIPVVVQQEKIQYMNDTIEKTIVAIRKDGKFVYINKKGEQQQLDSYDVRNLFIKNELNTPIFKEIEELEKQSIEIYNKIQDKRTLLIKEDLGLKELKAKYTR